MNIKVLKLALDADDRIPQELKDKLLKESQILFDFNEFMKKEYDLNDYEAEKLTKSYIEGKMKEGTKAEMAIVMESLATHYKFDRPKEFAEGMINLISLMEPDFE